jgi:hypothetical protein
VNARLFAGLILSVAVSACGLERVPGTVVEYPVSGVVTAGPVCPVEQDPPDPGCADRPVAGASLLVLDDAGGVVSQVVADADGRFRLSLPAGHYTLQPQPAEGLIGTAPNQEFNAGPGTTVSLVVVYDTGIR